MKEALIFVQSLSNQMGPALILACSSWIVFAASSAFISPLPKTSGALLSSCFFQSVI